MSGGTKFTLLIFCDRVFRAKSAKYPSSDWGRSVCSTPALAAAMGLDDASADGSLTPVEQDQLRPDQPLEGVLEQITWPEGVSGCAAVVERLVLPPGVDDQLPEDPTAAEEFAREHPDRQEVRIVAGATRGGSTYCALRLRAHDDDLSVIEGSDLVPALLELLQSTLAPVDPAALLDFFFGPESLSSSDSIVAALFFARAPFFGVAAPPRPFVPVRVERPLISLESFRASAASLSSRPFLAFFAFFGGGELAAASSSSSSSGTSSSSSGSCLRLRDFAGVSSATASAPSPPLTCSKTPAMTASTSSLLSRRNSGVSDGTSSTSWRRTRFALIVDKSVPGAERISRIGVARDPKSNAIGGEGVRYMYKII